MELCCARKARQDFSQKAGQEAILKLVHPVFHRNREDDRRRQFQFTEIPDGNPLSTLPLGFPLMIGSGVEYEISVASSKVWIKTVGSKSAGISVVYVYPGTQEPHISEPGDLTREKLGKLLALTIQETDVSKTEVPARSMATAWLLRSEQCNVFRSRRLINSTPAPIRTLCNIRRARYWRTTWDCWTV